MVLSISVVDSLALFVFQLVESLVLFVFQLVDSLALFVFQLLIPLFCLYFSWLNPLFKKGREQPLEIDDMYNVTPQDSSDQLGADLER